MAHLASLLLRAGDVETNPGPRFPCGVCGTRVGHTSVQCRTCRLWHHARCVGLKAADISRLARERGTWACRACPATPPVTPPASPRPRTPPAPPTPTPQPQPPTPTARRDASPTAAAGPRERRPAPPPSRGDRTTAARAVQQPLKILQLNCNGLAARLTKLLKRLADTNPQVVLLQETKLTAQEADLASRGTTWPPDATTRTRPISQRRRQAARDRHQPVTYRPGQAGPASAEAQQRATRGAPATERGRNKRSGPSLPPCHPAQRPRHQPEQRGTGPEEGRGAGAEY